MPLVDPNSDVGLMFTASTGQKFWLGSRPSTYLAIPAPVVICACKQTADNTRSRRLPLVVPLNDSPYPEDQPTSEDLRKVLKAIHVLIAGGDVFVHCSAGEQKLDIVQDFIDVITSMCARIYGRRAAKNRAKRAIAAAGEAG